MWINGRSGLPKFKGMFDDGIMRALSTHSRLT